MSDINRNNDRQDENKSGNDFWSEAAEQFDKFGAGIADFFGRAVREAEADPDLARKSEQFRKGVSDAAGKAGKAIFMGASLAAIGMEKLGNEIAKAVSGPKARETAENAAADVKDFAARATEEIRRSTEKAAEELSSLLQKAQKDAVDEAVQEGEEWAGAVAEETENDAAENGILEDEDLKTVAAREIARCAKCAADSVAEMAEEVVESAEEGTEAELLKEIRRHAMESSRMLAAIGCEAEQTLVTLSEKAKTKLNAKMKKMEKHAEDSELLDKLRAAAKANEEACRCAVVQAEKQLAGYVAEVQKDAVGYGMQAAKEVSSYAGQIGKRLENKLSKEFREDAKAFANVAKENLENLIRHCADELDILSAGFEEESSALLKAKKAMDAAESQAAGEKAEEAEKPKKKAGRKPKASKAVEKEAAEQEETPKKPRTKKKSKTAPAEQNVDAPSEKEKKPKVVRKQKTPPENISGEPVLMKEAPAKKEKKPHASKKKEQDAPEKLAGSSKRKTVRKKVEKDGEILQNKPDAGQE